MVPMVKSSIALLMIRGMMSWRRSTTIREARPKTRALAFSIRYGLMVRKLFITRIVDSRSNEGCQSILTILSRFLTMS